MKLDLCKSGCGKEQLMQEHSSLSLSQKLSDGVKPNLAISGKQTTSVWLTTWILCQQTTQAFFVFIGKMTYERMLRKHIFSAESEENLRA